MIKKVAYVLIGSWLLTLFYAALAGSLLGYHERNEFFGSSIQEEFYVILVIVTIITVAISYWRNK